MSARSALSEKNTRKCFRVAEEAGFKPVSATCLRGPVAEVVLEGHRDILVDYKAMKYLRVSSTLEEMDEKSRQDAVRNWLAAGWDKQDAESMALKMWPLPKLRPGG